MAAVFVVLAVAMLVIVVCACKIRGIGCCIGSYNAGDSG